MKMGILTNGWCNIKFEKTNCRVNASYLTDVPNDLLDMCINYYNNNTASCYFDSEGSTATLVLTPDTAFIIHEGEHLGLIKLTLTSLLLYIISMDTLSKLLFIKL